MADPVVSRLLSFARELQRASTFPELLDAARAEVRASVGYEHAWLMVADDEDVHEVKLIGASSDLHDLIWEFAPTLTIAGDAMLEEIVGSDAPVVVTDARTDPRTNKEIVAQIGNRTIVNRESIPEPAAFASGWGSRSAVRRASSRKRVAL